MRTAVCGSSGARACRHYVHPPVPRCSYCLDGSLVPEPVSGTGIVHSFTVNHQQWIPGSDPYVIGLVTIAEQDDVRLTTNLVDCAPDDVRVGMAVEVTFEQSEDVWLPLFRPTELKPTELRPTGLKPAEPPT